MMQNNDYNIIKPVENMQNVGAMTPIDKQTERRRRQNQQKQRRIPASQQGLIDEHRDESPGPGNSQPDQGSIDYRA
jgi:hypothetical protein